MRNHIWSLKKSQERFSSFGKLNSTLSGDKHEDSTAQCSGATTTNTGRHSEQHICLVAPVDLHFTPNRCMCYLCVVYYLWYHWLLTYIWVHISWLAAATFDLFLCCVWCIIWLQEGKHCGVFRAEGCNALDKYLFPVSWVFVCNLCNQGPMGPASRAGGV